MPPVLEGFWGKETSTLDWCEENYVVSYYIAEFWNTISNAVMIFAPLVMVFFGYIEKHEKRFIYSFLALAVVGFGSWLFHMTLKYSMQLMDELPMIWGTSFLIYSLYMMDSKPNEESPLLQISLIIYCVIVTLLFAMTFCEGSSHTGQVALAIVSLVASSVPSTVEVVYILVNIPIIHQVSYGLMVFCIVILASKMVLTMKCDKKLYMIGVLTYAIGFLLWNVDNMFCSHLRSIREHPAGKFSGMLFECHAWWHIFAGMGTYIALLFGVHTRYVFLKRKPHLKFLMGCWPYISIIDDGPKTK